MRKIGLIIYIMIGGLFTNSLSSLLAQDIKEPVFVPNRIIVKFKSTMSKNKTTQFKVNLKSKLKATLSRQLNLINAEVWQMKNQDVLTVIENWKNNPFIEYMEPDYFVYPKPTTSSSTSPNDPLIGSQWDMSIIQAPEAWDFDTGGDVIIGVIDVGVDYNHEDLAANMWTNPGEIPGNNIDDDNNGYIDDVHGYDFLDDDGDPMSSSSHGTICAGIVGAVGNNNLGVTGINWDTKIMALRVIGAETTLSDLIMAIEYATTMGAKITNNSYITGTEEFFQSLYDAIQAAGNANCLFVAATNNGSSGSGIYYPAFFDLDNIISVTATDENDDIDGTYNATSVDLGAPGGGHCTTNNNSYGSPSIATSYAAPHVAGVAALIWAVNPGLSVTEVKSAILNNVDANASLLGKTVTGGRLNAYNAISSLYNNTKYVSPGTWDNGEPTITSSVFFEYNYNTSDDGGSIHALNMVINPGIKLTIQNGQYVLVQNEFRADGILDVQQGGIITIQNQDN